MIMLKQLFCVSWASFLITWRTSVDALDEECMATMTSDFENCGGKYITFNRTIRDICHAKGKYLLQKRRLFS